LKSPWEIVGKKRRGGKRREGAALLPYTVRLNNGGLKGKGQRVKTEGRQGQDGPLTKFSGKGQ